MARPWVWPSGSLMIHMSCILLVLFASWRLGWTLLVWLFILLAIFLFVHCLRSLVDGIADLIQHFLERNNSTTGEDVEDSNHRPAIPPPPHGLYAENQRRICSLRASQYEVQEELPHSNQDRTLANLNLNVPDQPPQYDQVETVSEAPTRNAIGEYLMIDYAARPDRSL